MPTLRPSDQLAPPPSLGEILREWGRLGFVGFGGPPAHIALLQDLCVRERRWLSDEEFEHGFAATNLLPGPGSTQLAIYCAWRLGGAPAAFVGGLAFIVPGLVMIIALAALFLGSPPDWVAGAGAGAASVVGAIALKAGWGLLWPGWQRLKSRSRAPWLVYVTAGLLATVLFGALVVVVLVACGLIEVARQGREASRAEETNSAPVDDATGSGGGRSQTSTNKLQSLGLLPILASTASLGALGALCWTALKVGALSYGGGFVIIPLMQADAVDQHHWLTNAEFLNAVALGQITPGPVVHTVAVVGYSVAGVWGALLAAAVAFSPSFAFIVIGGERFDRMRSNRRVGAFMAGAGPAATGSILGAAVTLAAGLTQTWQFGLLGLGLLMLFAFKRGVVLTIVVAGVIGVAAVAAGASIPS